MVGCPPPPSWKCAAARGRTPLKTSDGSPLWSRATVTDGERPAAMVDATMNDGSLLQ